MRPLMSAPIPVILASCTCFRSNSRRRFIPRGPWEAVYLIEGLLANTSDIQPSTVRADTQGQNFPVFVLATLFGSDMMPRIRNFKDLIFFRASDKIAYPHIDQLFGESDRNVID
ncbi:Tn3 family transposase [Nonomuraea sp. JJY05]|jgi:TnpA family transposase|uniref:Tn3 family transposase n=1 Tax=Nonomuraea sp. JJY05 TaxID=3350255 RepID=UPI00373E5767